MVTVFPPRSQSPVDSVDQDRRRNSDALSHLANLQLDVSGSDRSLLFSDQGSIASQRTSASVASQRAAPTAAANDDDAPVRSDDNNNGDRPLSLSRSVNFGTNTSLRSMNPLPEHQQTPSMIDAALDAAQDAGRARRAGLERELTERRGNLSDRGSDAGEPVATAVATVDAVDDDGLGAPSALPVARDARGKGRGAPSLPVPGALKNLRRNSNQARNNRANALSLVSRQYDLNGDGVLDEVEQAMRDRDLDNDGRLDNREVHNIIQDQLKSQQDYGLYKRVAAGLLCLVALLSLSNFGTSWASAILAKDTSADEETGAIVSKKTGEAVGLQGTGYFVDIEPLSDDEFEQRRLLVDAEMAEDPDHPDHAHRRLGRNKNRNNACQCDKMGYDHGRVKERDLMKLVDKCDGARTVIARRKWKNGDIMDTAISVDYDTICAPGTKVKRKGKKKNNKNKTKTKVVDSFVEITSKGTDGKDKSITFDCEKGECFVSGNLVHQRAGHPCRIERDFSGASECKNGLACYDSDDHQARRGRGLCTELQERARPGQICDMRHSVNACEGNYICYPTGGKGRNAKISAGTVATGTCQPAAKFAELDEVCGVALGDDACADGFRCLGANGSKIRRGIGLCAATAVKRAKRNKVCSTDFGLDACEDHHACFPRNGDLFDTRRGRTRICQLARRSAGLEELCDFSYGADACEADYECFGENGCDYEEGFGLCRRTNDGGARSGAIVKFAKRNKACDIDRFGLDACESDRACFARNGNFFDTGRGRTRICQDVRPRAGRDGVCNVFFGDNACAAAGYECLGKNGRSIKTGFGVCQDVGGGSTILSHPAPPTLEIARAREGQACNMDYRNACVADHACYPWKGDFFYAGRDRTGICQFVGRNVGAGGACDASNNLGACAGGLQCLGNNGRSIQSGFGVCQDVGGASRTNSGGRSGGCSGSGACLPAGASLAMDCTNSCTCLSGTCMKYCNPGSDRWFCY